MPELSTSAFGWDYDIQAQQILQRSGGREVGTSQIGYARFSLNSDACLFTAQSFCAIVRRMDYLGWI
jgi:hypothetical protein